MRDGTLARRFLFVTSGLLLGAFVVSHALVRGDTPPPPVTVQFSACHYSANEDTEEIEVTVTLTGTPTGDVSVDYLVDEEVTATATPDEDYDASTAAGTVTFVKANGETEKKFKVTIYKDETYEPDETIPMKLDNPTGGAALGIPKKALLEILNDDKPPPPEIKSLTATVKSTPARTARKADGTPGDPQWNKWPNPIDLKFKSTKAITEEGDNLKWPADLFDDKKAVVLIKGGFDVQISVEVDNLGDKSVSFEVKRATDDHADVGAQNAVPTITSTGAKTATLQTNQRGSFQVLAFMDEDADGKWDKGEKGITMAYILISAEADAAGDRSKVHKDNFKIEWTGGAANPTDFLLKCGVWDQGAGKSILELDGDVTVVGGGAAGKRGLDRVYFGWSNTCLNDVVLGSYPKDGATGTDRTWKVVHVMNGNMADHVYGGRRAFWGGDKTMPNPENGMPFPIIDGKTNIMFGGNDICFSRSTANGKGTPVDAPKGQKFTITAFDSPADGAPIVHPLAGAKKLDTYHMTFLCTVRLIGWTNTAANDPENSFGEADSVGWRSYSHVRYNIWQIKGTWKLVPGGNWTVQNGDPVPDVTIDKNHHASALESSGLAEVLHPTVVHTLCYYAQ